MVDGGARLPGLLHRHQDRLRADVSAESNFDTVAAELDLARSACSYQATLLVAASARRVSGAFSGSGGEWCSGYPNHRVVHK